jgi:hypothetical protein
VPIVQKNAPLEAEDERWLPERKPVAGIIPRLMPQHGGTRRERWVIE